MTRGKRHFNIVIATDGSPAAKAAVATAVQFPWPDGTHAFAVVAKQVRADYRRSILLAALDRTAEFVAQAAARAVSRRWPDAEVRVVDASPVDAIVREAARRRADVIVMGWRGHGAVRRLVERVITTGAPLRDLLATVVKKRTDLVVVGAKGVTGVRHLLLGSVAEGALNRSPVPVLIVR